MLFRSGQIEERHAIAGPTGIGDASVESTEVGHRPLHAVDDLRLFADVTRVAACFHAERPQAFDRFGITVGPSTPNRDRTTNGGDALGHAETDTRVASCDHEHSAGEIGADRILRVAFHGPTVEQRSGRPLIDPN